MIQFFRLVSKKVSFRQALWMELEEDLGFLVRYWPGVFGFLFRYFGYKVLFKHIVSIPFIQPGVRFTHSRGISLGKNVTINSNGYFYGKGGIYIGDNVMIAPNCSVVAGSMDTALGDDPMLERRPKSEKIVIEKNAWLGANVVVLGGVTIGEGSVVGANSVVTKDTEAFSINVGSPARKIRMRQVESKHE